MAAVLMGRPWGSAVLRLLALLSVVLATGWLPTPAAAKAEWEPPTSPQPPSASAQQSSPDKDMIAEGQLLKVDTTAKMITIRTAADQQLQFSYSETTKITGDEKTVAGLATLSGTPVKVTYTKQGQENIASEIHVEKKSGA